MAEWSIAAVLKTVELRGSGGSNPSLSAKERSKKMSMIRHLFLFYDIMWANLFARIVARNKS